MAPGTDRSDVAILHANGVGPGFYAGLSAALERRDLPTVVPDLPGFCGAPAAGTGWAPLLDAVERDVRGRLDGDGVLVGHSLGGLLALLLAPRLPLRALVLLEPAVIPWRWLARLGAALYVRQVFDGPQVFTNRGPWYWRLHDPTSFPPEVLALVDQAHARTDGAVVAALNADLPSLYPLPFGRIRAPVTVVRGASSGPVMALGQRDLVRRLPVAHAVTIPAAGHWLANEQDEALADVIALAATRA
ncbi:MAG: alpha/beta hydrolase [Myxococcales bacterium]|nr:alpha/beta hydrolase [Myxococcales bacterium]